MNGDVLMIELNPAPSESVPTELGPVRLQPDQHVGSCCRCQFDWAPDFTEFQELREVTQLDQATGELPTLLTRLARSRSPMSEFCYEGCRE